jgi:putative glutamine amidotransferase
VREAGGLPLVIPPSLLEDEAPHLLSRLDGLILSGGWDITAEFYGSEDSPLVEKPDRERDGVEIVLAREAVRGDLPLLGICRGLQVLNVALGGTLYQDIPSQVSGAIRHRPNEGDELDSAAHTVRLEPGSRVASILDTEELEAISHHHQAAREVAKDLVVTARAPDGVIEGLEHRSHSFCLGVQWHPEIIGRSVPRMGALFTALIEAATPR